MQKVIGLDLGTYSIKVVEIINQFSGYEIVNFYENVVPNISEVSPDIVVPTVLEEIFTENKLQADRIITAMPGQNVSSRIMSFNFSDPKKIEAAVASEIEDIVPYNIENMIIDQQIIGQQDGKTIVLAVMTKKENMRSFLGNLSRINIDPRLVDIDALAFYNLSSTMNIDPDQVTALVDCGHEKTSLCIVQNGVLRMFRTINLGGKFLTDFLARDFEVPFTQAQRIKHDVSQVIHDHDDGSSLGKDERRVAKVLTAGANAIIKDLGRTLYSFKNFEKKPVGLIYLSGGTSQTKGFREYLEEQLEIPVVESRLDQSSLKINTDLGSHMATIPQSVAIGMRGISAVKRVSTINLRRGEFAFVQDYEKIFNAGISFAKVLSACFALLLLCYGLNYFFYKSQSSKITELYKKEAISYFPSLKKSISKKKVSLKNARKKVEKKFKSEIDDRNAAIEQFIIENEASYSVLTLARISEAIPEDLVLDVVKYQFDSKIVEDGEIANSIVLNFEVENFDVGDKIFDVLKAESYMIDAKKTEKNSPGKSSKLYSVSANIDETKI